ncbi:MAG: hypothetical protein RJB39_127 [Candidatus Parcubacteria bacterium]
MFKNLKRSLYDCKRWVKMIYTYPEMSLKKVDYDAYWADKRGKNIGDLSGWQTDRAEIIAKALEGQKENFSVLDIGGGDGNILNFLKTKKQLPITKMYNADTSRFALEQSEKFGIESIFCDIVDMKSFEKFPEADYAFMLEILEHIPNSEEFLLEIYRRMKKGVFFSVPNTGFIVYRLRLLFGKTPMQWRLHPAEHVRFWTITDMRFWLDGLGFKDKYTIYTYKGTPLLRKWFPNLFAPAMVVQITQ